MHLLDGHRDRGCAEAATPGYEIQPLRGTDTDKLAADRTHFRATEESTNLMLRCGLRGLDRPRRPRFQTSAGPPPSRARTVGEHAAPPQGPAAHRSARGP